MPAMPSQITSLDLLHHVKITGQVPEIITGILQQRIIAAHAHRLGIEISDDELQAGADQFRVTNNLGTITAIEKWLVDRTLSEDDFEELIINDLLTQKLAQQIFADQVEPFFYQHILDYGGAIISEVVVQSSNLAIELFYAIQEGDMSFSEVAHDYLTGAQKHNGGYRGLVKRRTMPPEISAAVFAAKPPQLIPPIKVEDKIHLILVTEIVPPQLNTEIREQILWDLFQNWLQPQIEQQQEQLDLKNINQ